MKHTVAILLLTGLLFSCAQNALQVTPPAPTTPNHLIEVQFNNSDHPTSNIRQVKTAGLQKQGLTPVEGGLQFTSLSTSTFTVKREGRRYLTATYRVTNNTGRTLQDLGFVGVALNDTDENPDNNQMDPTVSGTVFTHLKHYDGSDASETAVTLVPGALYDYDYQRDQAVLNNTAAQFQSGLDLSGFAPAGPAGLTMDVKDFGWFLEGSFPSGSSRVVTFSVSFPTAASSKDDPFSFSFMAAYSENAVVTPAPTTFVQLGGGLNLGSYSATNPHIAVDQNNMPVVAFQEWDDPTTADLAQVKRWNGTSWDLYPTPFQGTYDGVSNPDLALTPQGNPVVVVVDQGESTMLRVKRWTGATWEDLGIAAEMDDMQEMMGGELEPQIGVGPDGNPLVMYNGIPTGTETYMEELRVRKYQPGTGWTDLGGPLALDPDNGASDPSMTLNSAGNPLVVWTEGVSGQSSNVFVKTWNGTSWQQLGGALDVNIIRRVSYPSIAVGSNNLPVVAWTEDSGRLNDNNLYVRRWDGSNWVQLGGVLDANEFHTAYQTTVAVDSNNMPVVAWREWTGSGSNYHVKRWNGTGWETLLSPAFNEASIGYEGVDLAAGTNGSVSLAWIQCSATTGNQGKIFVKRFE